MKKIILGIIVLVILGGTGYWYFVLRQNNFVLSPSTSTGETSVENRQTQTTPRELAGVWRPQQFLKWYDPGKRFDEVTPSFEEKSAFLEFKDGFICQGQLNAQGETALCAQRLPTTIKGNKMRAGNETATWEIKNGKLELIFLQSDEKTPKEKIILTK